MPKAVAETGAAADVELPVGPCMVAAAGPAGEGRDGIEQGTGAGVTLEAANGRRGAVATMAPA